MDLPGFVNPPAKETAMPHPRRTCPLALVVLLLALAPAHGQDQPPSSPGETASPPFPFPVQPPPDRPANGAGIDLAPVGTDVAAGALAAPGPNLFGGVLGRMCTTASYNVTWLPEQPVARQPTNLGAEQQSFSITTPLWQDACDELSLSSHVRLDLIQTKAILPTSGMPFPDELWNIGLGTTYRHRFDNGWIAGGSVQFGSASDQPFHSINEINLGLNGFLRIPQGEHNAWLFTLSYSPTAQVPFPIPGVAFNWVPSDRFQATLGVPFSITWRPVDDLTLNLSYMLLTNIRARATYRIWGPVCFYTGYNWTSQGYFLADRTDSRERFLYYDMRVTGGFQANLGAWSLDLSSGYAFDRYYTQARQASLNGQDRVDVGAGPFLSLGVRLRW
jgi:hypothetical protein